MPDPFHEPNTGTGLLVMVGVVAKLEPLSETGKKEESPGDPSYNFSPNTGARWEVVSH